MIQYKTPSAQDAIALFQAIEARFPHQTLGDDRWYLVAISALAGCEPDFAANLYTYLVGMPRFATSESRQWLIRRLREAIVKDISIIGVCKPIEAILAISKVERDEDKEYSFSRQDWKSGPENTARGDKWLREIYRHNLANIEETWASHKDIGWISTNITYGLYLSDHSILDAIDTEMVVLSGIMIQNLRLETWWHLRGTRRVGVSQEDVELVHQCIEMVAEFAGVSLHKVPRVAEVEHEV